MCPEKGAQQRRPKVKSLPASAATDSTRNFQPMMLPGELMFRALLFVSVCVFVGARCRGRNVQRHRFLHTMISGSLDANCYGSDDLVTPDGH